MAQAVGAEQKENQAPEGAKEKLQQIPGSAGERASQCLTLLSIGGLNIGWAALIGFVVTMAGGFLTRFSSIGWRLLPFGIEALGPLGDVIFNSCGVFVLLILDSLWKSD